LCLYDHNFNRYRCCHGQLTIRVFVVGEIVGVDYIGSLVNNKSPAQMKTLGSICSICHHFFCWCYFIADHCSYYKHEHFLFLFFCFLAVCKFHEAMCDSHLKLLVSDKISNDKWQMTLKFEIWNFKSGIIMGLSYDIPNLATAPFLG
jgi:hypothetical protein